MVVISIISLLSSVVLAGVQVAKDKAKTAAFRKDVEQFIVAVEMYRNDNGMYPGGITPTNLQLYTISGSYNPAITPLLVPKYIKKLPTPTSGTLSYGNKIPNAVSYPIKCKNNSTTPNYVIIITDSTPGFEDWQSLVWSGDNGNTWTPYNGYKCFSL